MNWTKEFVALDKSVHDRPSFHCSEPELSNFLQRHASRHMEARVSMTMVLPASNPLPNGKYPICAFYTVAPGSINRGTLPPGVRKKLPQYPIPVFLIAQMAVHSECKGKGLGKITLIKALEYLWNINKQMRAYAVIVDCLKKDVEQFYTKYGFQILYVNNGRTRMFLPMETVGMLFE